MINKRKNDVSFPPKSFRVHKYKQLHKKRGLYCQGVLRVISQPMSYEYENHKKEENLQNKVSYILQYITYDVMMMMLLRVVR